MSNLGKFKTAQAGLIMVEPLPCLYDKHNCLAACAVYQATSGKELGILIASFSTKPVHLAEGQAVAKGAEHPVALMERTITHGEMLGVVKTKTVYNKRNKSTRDIDVINKHLADAREAAVSKADETIDFENVRFGVDEKYHQEIRRMLRKHNVLWSCRLGNVNNTQYGINPISGARSFKSVPY